MEEAKESGRKQEEEEKEAVGGEGGGGKRPLILPRSFLVTCAVIFCLSASEEPSGPLLLLCALFLLPLFLFLLFPLFSLVLDLT